MIVISATDVRKKLGLYKRLADPQPIEVTRGRRPSTVLMSWAEYSRLKALDQDPSPETDVTSKSLEI